MADATEMLRRVDDLGDRISRRVQELQTKGEFSDVHDAIAKELKIAHAKLRDQVGSAAADTTRLKWRGLKDEMTRDYNSLVDSVGRFAEHLDTKSMKVALEEKD